jgi:hypothetical protein
VGHLIKNKQFSQVTYLKNMNSKSNSLIGMISNEISYIMPSEIITSETGHEILWRLYADLYQLENGIVKFDCVNLSMIHGNMCALFILLTDKLRLTNGLSFRLINCKPEPYDFFNRNGLMSHLHDVPNSYDNRKSVVPIRLFNPQLESEHFCHYIENDLLGHRGLDKLPDEVKEWLRLGFEETFANVAEHANTNIVCTSGQFFPLTNQFRFTICDLGDGFYKKIATYTKKNGIHIASISEGLTWGLSGNSTREDIYSTEGGVALARLIAHCKKDTRCSFLLVTDNHFWQVKNGEVICRSLPYTTQGTTIHLIFA